jgi:hypothetical protein
MVKELAGFSISFSRKNGLLRHPIYCVFQQLQTSITLRLNKNHSERAIPAHILKQFCAISLKIPTVTKRGELQHSTTVHATTRQVVNARSIKA